jgi:hypothetical protein
MNLDGSIPSDNPFFNQAGKRGEIFAYGFRDPFRFGFDPMTGKLWVADVGCHLVAPGVQRRFRRHLPPPGRELDHHRRPVRPQGLQVQGQAPGGGPVKSAQVKAGKLLKATGKGTQLGHSLVRGRQGVHREARARACQLSVAARPAPMGEGAGQCYTAVMTVSERDQDYMRRIGEAKTASHAEAAAAQRARPLAERLRRSWALYLECRSTIRDHRDDDPSPFYERARVLGLYRP